VAGALVDGAGAPAVFFCLDLLSMPFELVARIYDEPSGVEAARTLTTGTLVGAYLFWTALFSAITWLRYRRMTVTR
jgi:hypothetical protein